jgi:hypothetical protein
VAVGDPLAVASPSPLSVQSRRRMLDMLRAAGDPLDARQLVAAVCLHVTTVRFHLAKVHLGLPRGALRRLGVPARGVTLRPFVEPELCTVELLEPASA